jgi:succinate dehydrogenase/fumarate reductase flavoprotein subunit
LYVAGDVATRELICGGFTGGGSHNAAWALSSGTWAGIAAARHARSLGPAARRRRLVPTGQAGLRPTGAGDPGVDHRAVVQVVKDQTHPYDVNYLRHGARLTAALSTLDIAWTDVRRSLRGDGAEALGARQAAAMVAHARWMYTAALARPESRGMHKRLDHRDPDPAYRHRLLTGGLDELWTAPDPVRPHTPLDLVAAS